MTDIGLLLVFWYGVLHAFAPDHLSAIVDLSLGKTKRKTLFFTLFFALGHGLMLFIFAHIVTQFFTAGVADNALIENITAYADLISASVIIGLGLYLLLMVFNDKVQLSKHYLQEHKQGHQAHRHSNSDSKKYEKSAFSLGTLMGLGGIRSMLVTLSLVSSQPVTLSLVAAFALGVMLVFICFGLILSYINENFLHSQNNVRIAFGCAGSASIMIGSNMLI